MSDRNRTDWWRARRRAAALGLALAAAAAVYLTFFTPAQRSARRHLGDADTKARAAIDERAKPVRELFAEGRKGAKGFAREVLSLEGKWELVRGAVDPARYKKFLADAFARHVFSTAGLKAAVQSCCVAYLSDLDAVEAEMLVRLRADLADRPPEALPPHLRSGEEFDRQYQALATQVTAAGGSDLAVAIGREAVMAVVSEIVTRAALQAAQAAAAELGIQSAALSSGAVSTAATLGVGLVIYFIIDYVVDVLFKAVGYDPEEQVAAAVVTSLAKMEEALLGDAGWRQRVGLAKHGALRAELERLHAARSARRREAVKLLISEGGAR